MGWSVSVLSEELPDVKERIASFSSCPGNLYTCVKELYGKYLGEMPNSQYCADALSGTIRELDEGDAGKFNDEFCMVASEKWDGGKEISAEWVDWQTILKRRPDVDFGFTDYKSFCGQTMRARLREDAVRFLLYYLAGYDIKFEQ